MEIQVYALQIHRELSDTERECLLGGLPYLRYQRLIRTRENKQNQAMCAYGLLRFGLLKQYDLRQLPDIMIGDEGKPSFSDFPEIHFNLSHTNGAVACAIHDHPVGIDLEEDREAAQTLLTHYGIPSRELFWEMWVRREAIAKCQGHGTAALTHWNGELETGVMCQGLAIFPGYYGALATEERDAEVICQTVTLDEMMEKLLSIETA